MRLEGHVALVTGANGNIGRAIALELAGCGCAVIVNASRSRQEAEAVVAEARTYWLASDDGSFVSGQMIGVNGGAST